MGAIPYSTARRLSSLFGLPKTFYWSVFDLLTSCNGLLWVLSNIQLSAGMKRDIRKVHMKRYSAKDRPLRISAVSAPMAFFVFHHIIYRTFQFEKLFDFIRPKEIAEGIPGIAVPPCGLGETTIKRTLLWLSPPYSDFLIKIKIKLNRKNIITPMYGLHIAGFLRVLDSRMKADLLTREVDRDVFEEQPLKVSNVLLRGRFLVSACLELIQGYEPAFKFLSSYRMPIRDLATFMEELKGHLPVADAARLARQDFEATISDSKRAVYLRKRYREGDL